MFKTVRIRLLILNLGLIIFGFGSLTIWAGGQIAQATWDDYGKNQEINTVTLANALIEPLEDGFDQIQATATTAGTTYNAEVTVYDRSGQPIVSTGNRTALIPTGRYQRIGGDVASSAEIIYEGETVGYVQIVTNGAGNQLVVAQRWLELFAGFAIFSLIGIVITVWLLNSLTRPLDTLRSGALQIAEGQLDHRLIDLPDNEIGAVGHAFNTMAERAENLIQEQRAFASNASHELRTPLTTIQLRTEALKSGLDPDLEERYIGEIDSEVQRLSRLVDDLMLLSRLDAHRLEAGLEEIDLTRLLQHLIHEFAEKAAAKPVRLSIQGDVKPVMIAATLSHARLVFRNVIENSIKYMEPNRDDGRVAVHILPPTDGRVRVLIEDNGPGIDPAVLPEIGNRFFRTDKARGREVVGTGLGLALVGSILALYGGSIDIQSDGLGQGARVSIEWPALTPEPAEGL